MQIELFNGNCMDQMLFMADNSVDSIVTDPPYGLSFMGKKWDYDVPSVEIWAECLRVLKPGGHLLAFAGTRTQHRMAVRIEDAGFEIRDMIAWVYGSGFPKSMDVSKAIDKTGGKSIAWFGPWFRKWRESLGLSQKEVCERCGFYGAVNRGGAVANWELGLNIPTPEQFNIIRDTFGLPFESIDAAAREVIGQDTKARSTSGASALPTMGGETVYQSWDITAPATDAARQWDGWGTALKPALEPITVARKPLVGTVAANVLVHGTGALNIAGCRVATDENLNGGAYATVRQESTSEWARSGSLHKTTGQEFVQPSGRWPANLIHDGSDEVLEAFPVAKGQQGDLKGHNKDRESPNGVFGRFAPAKDHAARVEVETSAARFFYCAKASKKDRGEGNTHPTVKPTDLMRYLCRLVTPPGGVVFDPFMGSGSTGRAALLEGFGFLGSEMEEAFFSIAKARIAAVQQGSD